jgi:hypothetical protein
MDKLKLFGIAILFLIILGFVYNRISYPSTTTTTTTTKSNNRAVVVKQPVYVAPRPPTPPPSYNPYKAQYY